MDINLFRDLEALKKTGNFSQAAALRNMSQPAFSRRIKSLETWVGAVLVARSTQPVKLNSAGAQILEAGVQAITRIEYERSQILDALSLPDKYVVTFGTQHSIGWRFYPAWLQALEEAHGPILSRLRADDLPGCLRDLSDGNVDFVIAYGRQGEDDTNIHRGTTRAKQAIETLRIGADKLIAVCKPTQDGTPLFDLARVDQRLPYLRFGENAPIGRHLRMMLREHNLAPRLHTVYENAMAGALRIRAHAGDGVAWLPHSLALPDLENGLLVRTGDAAWEVALEIYLFRIPTQTNRVTRTIWSFLEARQAKPLL